MGTRSAPANCEGVKQALLVAIALLLPGCASLGSGNASADSPPGLHLIAHSRDATAGATAPLSLVNETGTPAGYNLCFGALEKRRGALWVPAFTPGKNCPQVFQTLAPGQQAAGETPLASALNPGEYRYVTRVKLPEDRFEQSLVRSDGFTISPPAN